MTIVYPTVDVLMDFGAGLVSVAADVLLKNPLHASWGIQGCDPAARVARSGQFTFDLNNSEYNSATKLGYYSPLNSNLRSGFGLETPVVIKLTYGATTKYKRFYISNIDPLPGVHAERTCSITALDLMNRLTRQDVKGLAVQVSKRTDQALATLMALLPVAPLATALSVAPEVQAYLFTDITDGTPCMTAIQNLAMTDASYVGAKGDATVGETFFQETRQERQLRASLLTLQDTSNLTKLSAPSSETAILNDVTVSCFPGIVGTVAEVLYQSPVELRIGAGRTITFDARYSDPNSGNGSSISVVLLPGAGVTPVAGTDFKASFTSGNEAAQDANSALTITVTWWAAYATVSILNTSTAQDAYVLPFILRGKIIRIYNPLTSRIQDTTGNYQKYGRSPLSYSMPYQSNLNFANDMANHWFGMWHLPSDIPPYFEFVANEDATTMTGALTVDLGSRFTGIEVVTGVSTDYCVMGIDLTLEEGAKLTLRYYPEPVNLIPACILNDAVYGVLDSVNCRVGF
jgi:hypothetical protein